MRPIKKIVIHCSDSDDSLDFGFKDIDEWHRQRGFLSDSGISCGYHYIIRRDGTLERGRPDEEVGAHVKGHNSNSLGICIIGRKNFSDIQITKVKRLVNALCEKYRLVKYDDVYGHYEFDSNKTCPNIDMVHFRAELLFEKGKISP